MLAALMLTACTGDASTDPLDADDAGPGDTREWEDGGPILEPTENPSTMERADAGPNDGGKGGANAGGAGAAGSTPKPNARDGGDAATDAEVGREPDAGTATDPSPEPTGQATSFSGTWKGTLRSPNDSQDVAITISAAGNFVFTYTNQSGQTRQVELTMVGQTVSWVPSGGGVLRVTVDSIASRSGGLRITWHGRFEKSSQGNLDQEDLSVSYDLMVDAGMLRARQTVQDVQFLNGTKLSESTTTREGSLQRQ